jgi:hypothetical protein
MSDERCEILARMTLDELDLFEFLGGDFPSCLREGAGRRPVEWVPVESERLSPATRHNRQIELLELAELETPQARREFFNRYAPPA